MSEEEIRWKFGLYTHLRFVHGELKWLWDDTTRNW